MTLPFALGIPQMGVAFILLGFYCLIIVVFMTLLGQIACALKEIAKDLRKLSHHFTEKDED